MPIVRSSAGTVVLSFCQRWKRLRNDADSAFQGSIRSQCQSISPLMLCTHNSPVLPALNRLSNLSSALNKKCYIWLRTYKFNQLKFLTNSIGYHFVGFRRYSLLNWVKLWRTCPAGVAQWYTAQVPRAGITRSPKQRYQWPHKKDLCPPKVLKKNSEELS